MSQPELFAGVELGGTKVIAVLARGREIVDHAVWPTLAAEETLTKVARRLQDWNGAQPISALGIASFGPLQLNGSAAYHGCILKTPKPGWSSAPVAQLLTDGLPCPWQIDTDVNAAALAEHLWGEHVGCDSLCYLTLGTGVGGGLVIGGKPVHGAMHPEIGHLRLRRADGDTFAGSCTFHGDCIEGLISGPALAMRLGGDPAGIADDDPRWHAVASDLAELACAILLTTSAQRILVGGGVGMSRPFLLTLARSMMIERLQNYLPFFDQDSAETILRVPSLGYDAGPLGAIALAMSARGEGES